jgi:hypothetical protein
MGDITKGYTWLNGVALTPARLHKMVDDATINSAAVTTAKIDDAAVTTAKIDDDAVTADKLAATLDLSAKTSIILPGEAINGRTAGTSLVDADEFLYYDSASPGLKKVTRAALLPVGSVLQTVYAEHTTALASSTTIPLDDTIPQITEGTELLSASITPSSASNKILCVANLYLSSASGRTVAACLFRAGTTDALTVGSKISDGNVSTLFPITLHRLDAPSSTSAQTYSVRFGTSSSAARAVSGTTAYYGDKRICSLTLQEIKG